MSYRTSAARSAFRERSGKLRRSFRYAKVRPLALPGDIRQLVFHASVFHLSAALEDYLLQSLTAWMFEVQRRTGANTLLPTRLRKFLFLKANEGTLRNLVVTGSEKEALDRMDGPHSGLVWLRDSDLVPNYRFYDPAIRDKKFPSVDNMDALFRRFGIDNIIDKMSRKSRSDVALTLKSFIDVRNSIAHEAPPELTEDDLERHFGSVDRWVSLIDRILHSQVIRASGRDYWQV